MRLIERGLHLRGFAGCAVPVTGFVPSTYVSRYGRDIGLESHSSAANLAGRRKRQVDVHALDDRRSLGSSSASTASSRIGSMTGPVSPRSVCARTASDRRKSSARLAAAYSRSSSSATRTARRFTERALERLQASSEGRRLFGDPDATASVNTYASLALAAGVHPKVVSERLVPSTVSITLDLYSHSIPALGDAAAQTVAAVIFGEAR